jgi:hypothetical protein
MFNFLEYTRFGFELFNQKMFEMKILKMARITYILSYSICKWLFVKMLIYHILMVIALKNINLWYDNYQTLHMVHKLILIIWMITMFNRYGTFHKDQKSFQSFLEYICIFVVFLIFDFFGFWLTITCKSIVKIFHDNDMVKVQTWDP